MEGLVYDVVIPIAVIIALVMFVTRATAYMKTLWVSGKPNEWVLIMRNGVQIRAGVGL